MRRDLRKLAGALAVLGCAVFLRQVVFDVVRVRTGSMEPAIREGAVVLTARLAEPEVGDVVAVDLGDGLVHVKRLVARGPGEVELSEGRLYVHGEAAWSEEAPLVWIDGQCRERVEAGVQEGDRVVVRAGDHERTELAAGELWLLGDSRHRSHDSRQWGPVHADSVVGVVAGIAWPGPSCESRL